MEAYPKINTPGRQYSPVQGVVRQLIENISRDSTPDFDRIIEEETELFTKFPQTRNSLRGTLAELYVSRALRKLKTNYPIHHIDYDPFSVDRQVGSFTFKKDELGRNLVLKNCEGYLELDGVVIFSAHNKIPFIVEVKTSDFHDECDKSISARRIAKLREIIYPLSQNQQWYLALIAPREYFSRRTSTLKNFESAGGISIPYSFSIGHYYREIERIRDKYGL